MATVTGTARRKDLSYYRQVGTAGFAERWYHAGVPLGQNAIVVAGGALSIDQFFAVPHFEVRGGTLDRLGFVVTANGAAGSVCRVGIYQATSDEDLYPNNLIVDGGERVTDAGAVPRDETATIDVQLLPDTLYWFVILAGVANPSIRVLDASRIIPILGTDGAAATVNLGWGFSNGRVYGALPATYPPAAAVQTTVNPPYILFRYSD